MKCLQCKADMKNRNVCTCGWKPNGDTPKDSRVPCQSCGEIHNSSYLKAYNGREVCSECLVIDMLKPEDRAYFKQMSDEYKFPLVDMPTHLQAAGRLNITLGAYLLTLPRNRQEFKEYWKDKHPTVAGVRL